MNDSCQTRSGLSHLEQHLVVGPLLGVFVESYHRDAVDQQKLRETIPRQLTIFCILGLSRFVLMAIEIITNAADTANKKT
jgi:hypothetical protein